MRCILILMSLFMLRAGAGAEAQTDTTSTSRIAAVVNKNIITKTDLMNRLKFAATSSGLEPSPENLEKMKDQMLRVMIDEQLQLEIGQKFGIAVSNEHVQATIKDIEKSNGMAEGHITQMLKEHNIPLKTFEDQIKAQLIWVVYIREKYPLKTLEDQIRKKYDNDISPSLQIADWEIDREMKQQKEKDTKTQYHLAEIVLPLDRPDQEESVKQNMNQLIEELQKGAHFSALAQQFSQSASASLGGDMGWITEDQLDSEIKEALAHLQPGQLSMPIRTSQGYSLIAYIERKLPSKDGNVLLTVQQVLFPFPKDVSEDKAREIMSHADTISRNAKNCSALEKATQQKFPSALFQLLSNEPMGNFPEELLAIINKLDINQASQPLLTPEGGLVIMVCDKKVQNTKELTREEVIAMIASQKHSLLARRELRDLKRHAFIDIRT